MLEAFAELLGTLLSDSIPAVFEQAVESAAAMFTIAFLAGHTLIRKPSAGNRTNVMFGFLAMCICAYRIHVEGADHPDSSVVSVQSATKNLYIQGTAFALSVVGLFTATDPPPKFKPN